jgi:hypothetical protein
MRRLVLATLLVLAGCSKPTEPGSEAQEAATGGDNATLPVGATQLPGVAMTYAYTFRLPGAALQTTQETHARQCEGLGPTRCRITGAEFHRGAHGTISASLAMKLAPLLARQFGKRGIDTVAANGGMLTDSEIASRDAGLEVAAADRDIGGRRDERAQIQGQLARKDLPEGERMQLQYRAQQLREVETSASAARTEAALVLASTPLTFYYRSGTVDPGLDDGPILGAVKDGWANIVAGVGFIILFVVTLLPWILAALLLWLAVVRLKAPVRRLIGLPPEDDARG